MSKPSFRTCLSWINWAIIQTDKFHILEQDDNGADLRFIRSKLQHLKDNPSLYEGIESILTGYEELRRKI